MKISDIIIEEKQRLDPRYWESVNNRAPESVVTEGKTVAVKFYDEFDTGYVVHIGDNTLSINGNEVDTNYQWDRKKGHAFSGAEPYVSEWMYKMAKSWGDVHAWLKRVRDTGDEKSILAAVQKAFKTGSMKPKIVENIEEGHNFGMKVKVQNDVIENGIGYIIGDFWETADQRGANVESARHKAHIELDEMLKDMAEEEKYADAYSEEVRKASHDYLEKHIIRMIDFLDQNGPADVRAAAAKK